MRSATPEPLRRGMDGGRSHRRANDAGARPDLGAGAALRAIETSHARISTRETPGAGTPLVLLHGRFRCRAEFVGLAERLHRMGRRTVEIDLPGHGASGDGHDPDLTYVIEGYADSVIEVLEHLGIERAAVVGRSLGAHVGLEMEAAFPGFSGLLVEPSLAAEARPYAPYVMPAVAMVPNPRRLAASAQGCPRLEVVSRADERYRRLPPDDRDPTLVEMACARAGQAFATPFAMSSIGLTEPRRPDRSRAPSSRPGHRSCPERPHEGGAAVMADDALPRFLETIDRVSPDVPLVGLCLSG